MIMQQDKGQASRQYFIDMSGLRKLAFSAAINKFNMMSTVEMENLNQMLSTVLPNKNTYANSLTENNMLKGNVYGWHLRMVHRKTIIGLH